MFKSHPQSAKRKRSAITLFKCTLANKNPNILRIHRRELLRILLFKITEAESTKKRTRFQSSGALRCADKSKLIHEHVFPRVKMIEEAEKAKPSEVSKILKKAVACTVTVKEHARLSIFSEEYGWDRYRKAKVRVKDTQTGKWKISPEDF